MSTFFPDVTDSYVASLKARQKLKGEGNVYNIFKFLFFALFGRKHNTHTMSFTHTHCQYNT